MTVKDENGINGGTNGSMTVENENVMIDDVENGGTEIIAIDSNEDVEKAKKKPKSPDMAKKKRKSSGPELKRDPPGLLSNRHLQVDGEPHAIAQPETAFVANQKDSISRKKSSMLADSDDPFAFREGKTLMWRNINMTLVRMKNAKSSCVLSMHLTSQSFCFLCNRNQIRRVKKAASSLTKSGERSRKCRPPLSWVQVEQERQVF
jgi:hypothetical protein